MAPTHRGMVAHRRREIVSTQRTQEVARRHRERIDGELIDAAIARARLALDDAIVRAARQPLEQLEIRELVGAARELHSVRRVGLRLNVLQ